MEDLTDLFRWYYFENEGWWRVWKANYKKLSKLSLSDKALFQKKIKARFGRNVKAERIFQNEIIKRDFVLQDLAGNRWHEGTIAVPLEWGGD